MNLHYINQGPASGANRRAATPSSLPSSTNATDNTLYAHHWPSSSDGNGDVTSSHPQSGHLGSTPHSTVNEENKANHGPFSVPDNTNGYTYPNHTYTSHQFDNTPRQDHPTASSPFTGDKANPHPRPHSNGSQYMYNNSPAPNQSQQYSPLNSLRGQQSEVSSHEVPPAFGNQSQSSATNTNRNLSLKAEPIGIGGGGDPGGGNIHSNDMNVLNRGTHTNTANINGNSNASGNHRENINPNNSENQQSQPFLSNTTTSMNTFTNIINTYNTSSSVSGTTVLYNNATSTMPCSPLGDTYTVSSSSPQITLPDSAASSSAAVNNPQFNFFSTGSHQSVIMTSEPGSIDSDLKPVTLSSTSLPSLVKVDSISQATLTSNSNNTNLASNQVSSSAINDGNNGSNKTLSSLLGGGIGHDMGIECGRLIDQLESASTGFGGLLMDLNPCTVNTINNKSDLPLSSSFLSSSLSSLTSSPSSSTSSSPSLSSTANFIASESHPNHLNQSSGNTVLPPVSTFLLPNLRDHTWWDRMKTPNYGSTITTRMDYRREINCDSLDCNEEERGEREYAPSPSSALTSLTTASLTH